MPPDHPDIVATEVPLSDARPAPGQVRLRWLGQAGFLVETADLRIMVDPYLSDSLARKYAGTQFPHVRRMPPPVRPQDVRGLHWVLCTHCHTDHMDGQTLGPIQANVPACRFVIPRAERQHALAIGLLAERLVEMDAGERAELGGGAAVEAVASAHERIETNERGEHHYLGYVLRLAGLSVYHSGDCVPYPGLAQTLREKGIHVALLPINGRDELRASKGVPGNFSFEEAVALCREASILVMVAHHWGMFDFNTADPHEVRAAIARLDAPPAVYLPDADMALAVSRPKACRRALEGPPL